MNDLSMPHITETTQEITLYQWECPITGEPVSSEYRPRDYEDTLSNDGREIFWINKQETWLKQFRESEGFRERQGAVIMNQIPYVDEFEDFDSDGSHAEISELILKTKSGKYLRVTLSAIDDPFLTIKNCHEDEDEE